MRYMIYLSTKRNVPGTFSRRVRILAERFYMIGGNFLSYKKFAIHWMAT